MEIKEIELIRRKLAKNNVKVTPQRRAVIECFLENRNNHMSAEEIYMKISEKHPETGLATVYRTLDLLERYDIIKRIKSDRVSVYELKQYSKKSTHFHIRCKRCGRLIDVVDREFELKFLNFKEEVESRYGCVLEDIQVIMEGTCAECCK